MELKIRLKNAANFIGNIEAGVAGDTLVFTVEVKGHKCTYGIPLDFIEWFSISDKEK